MSEPKDPAIKLFGKTIPLPEVSPATPRSSSGATVITSGDDNHELDSPSSTLSPEANTDGDGEDLEVDKETLGEKSTETKKEDGDGSLSLSTEECSNTDTSVVRSESLAPSGDDSDPLNTVKTDEQNETSNSQEKVLKKPDKILPCPRCNSMDTKFCYYNNYNVNQPRHFCKNCQRYWTAGGTMRNVPVGAGRRKNKNSASHHRQIIVAEALQNARTDVSNGIHHSALKPNGNVLAFGSDSPLCESMASILNLADKTRQNITRNGFQKPEALQIPVSNEHGGNDDHSKESEATPTFLINEEGKAGPQDQVIHGCQGFLPPQIPFFPGAPWPYPWNSAQWSSPVPPPTFYPPGFPMPFYPPTAAFWGCTIPGTWTVPWLPQPPPLNPTSQNNGPNSPTLGKHSRDENVNKQSDSEEEEQQKENNAERCLWIPKTLRIDDPGEAAKSSIWATLGIKNDKADSVSEGLFKAFQSKGDDKNHKAEPSPVLQVNPAAMSRSIKFHESS